MRCTILEAVVEIFVICGEHPALCPARGVPFTSVFALALHVLLRMGWTLPDTLFGNCEKRCDRKGEEVAAPHLSRLSGRGLGLPTELGSLGVGRSVFRLHGKTWSDPRVA